MKDEFDERGAREGRARERNAKEPRVEDGWGVGEGIQTGRAAVDAARADAEEGVMDDGAGRVKEIGKGRGEFVGEEIVSGVARGGVRGVKSEGAGVEQREGG